MQLIVSGSLAYDRLMAFDGHFRDHLLADRLDAINVCFTVFGVEERFGGTAGNIAYNLALLGQRPLILATVGSDFGRYRERLQRLGLPTEGIREEPGQLTACAYITTDRGNNQITTFNLGALNFPCGYDLSRLPGEEALAIISPGNPGDMLTQSRFYKQKKIDYIFDPGQSIPILEAEHMVEMITGSRLLICNDYERDLIRQATGLDRETLLSRTGALLTTLGEAGSELCTPAGTVSIAAVGVRQVVDPTGAGDAYRAGLMAGLADGRPLPAAARMGAVCASFAVEKMGTQEHRFDTAAFDRRFREHFDAANG